MKKALKLALIYLILLIVGIIPGTLIYALYLNVLDFITGNEIIFFADSDLFEALFFVTYCMIFFICPLICYYRVRHPGGFLQLLVYIILCILTWVILFPSVLKLNDYARSKLNLNESKSYLSSNYFRRVDNKIYYFTKDFESKNGDVAETSAIVIDTRENGEVKNRIIKDYPTQDYNRKALPFREIQLKKIFDMDKVTIPVDFKVLLTMAENAFSKGIPFFLTYLSFVLLLSSVYAITYFFDWRLISSVMLFIFSTLIMCLNSIYFTPLFDTIKTKAGGIAFFHAFGRIVSEPLLFIVNCIIAIIIISSGIIKVLANKHKGKVK